jgi:hypothetical protein
MEFMTELHAATLQAKMTAAAARAGRRRPIPIDLTTEFIPILRHPLFDGPAPDS